MGQDAEYERSVTNEAVMVGSQVSKVALVRQLLQDLGTATLRPLFAELALQNKSFETKQQSWLELLDEAVSLLPYCSDDEYGEILHIMSVFLLAFLLPYATGMDFYLLQNMKDGPKSTFPSKEGRSSVDECIIQMSLEERLEKTVIPSLSSNRYGGDEFTTLTDVDVEVGLGDLLDRISRILQRRPLHSHQVDLVHLLAMIIHPYFGPDSMKKVFDSSLERSSPGYVTAVRFMENPIGLQFHIHYGHRRQLVQMVQRVLILPDLDLGRAPLFAGAIPHLIASLRQFSCHNSEDLRDSHDALAAIVSLVVQYRSSKHDTTLHSVVKSEWDWLLHRTMDDRSIHPCREHCRLQKSEAFERSNVAMEKPDAFCTYTARAHLLSQLIERRCEHKTDPLFLAHAAQMLAEAIEWQVDCWSVDTSSTSSSDITVTNKNSPCLLASLLMAAKQLFGPWTLSSVDGNLLIDDDPFGTILNCAVQLLSHSNLRIVTAAADALVHAFTYECVEKLEPYFAPLALAISSDNFQRIAPGKTVDSVVAAVSCKSQSFSLSILNVILKRLDIAVATQKSESDTAKFDETSRKLMLWLVAIAINRPEVCVKKVDALLAFLQDRSCLPEQQCHLLHALLFTRQTHFFRETTDSTICEAAEFFVKSEATSYWLCYQVGRNAVVSGNAGAALPAFRKILNRCAFIDTIQYLWISVLERIATADTFLSSTSRMNLKESVLDIPSASIALNSAWSYMDSLRTICMHWENGGAFQIRFLLLRLDFLDLIIVFRQLTRERRLTGKGPVKGTRSYLHLRNVVRCFDVLASRYHELVLQYGLFFKHCQSITSLSVLQLLSSFMAHAAKACFSDVFNPRTSQKKVSMEKSPFYKANDTMRHPMAFLIERLDELVVQPMIQADVTEPLIRAAATLEVIDGILLVPFPIPRDFFTPRPFIVPELLISAAPEPIFTEFDEAFSIIETAPLMCFSFSVSGRVPAHFFQDVSVPTWTIVLWFQIKYSGPLLLDDEDNNDLTGADNNSIEGELSTNAKDIRIPDLAAVSPASSALSVDGFFFFTVECPPMMDEGLYLLNAKLGCRDIHGNEWEFPSCRPESLVATIRVSSTRSVL